LLLDLASFCLLGEVSHPSNHKPPPLLSLLPCSESHACTPVPPPHANAPPHTHTQLCDDLWERSVQSDMPTPYLLEYAVHSILQVSAPALFPFAAAPLLHMNSGCCALQE